ncbi:hypothetical protein QA635_32790 [Bradyrhizobium brasilense]|uniref:hypothetical protein n=1 Tax=Bradyrhizobium brasilense TaxID=1419277 RepID=UPI0024B12A2F|nr:hypothetical protein [Bradyrhizobium australafricanum]WFU31301.1 hypothetical protein QA635_32790 [Bradyrhizobium australafricanum]
MDCLHPHCPAGHGAKSWKDVVESPLLRARKGDKPVLLAALAKDFGPLSSPPYARMLPVPNAALIERLVRLCPCLFNQLDLAATAEAIVHLCEISLGAIITSANVYDAFQVQYPGRESFAFPPVKGSAIGGTVMEMFCSEVLQNEQIPRMETDAEGWPKWRMPGHILLNQKKMKDRQALGDIMIPCAPTNLLISVKTEAARERLLYSANSIEGIGFGFFSQPHEFWTPGRMRLFKRMGFSAIYLPDNTHQEIAGKLDKNGETRFAVNLNGTALYRPLSQFGSDMRRVVGRSSFDL